MMFLCVLIDGRLEVFLENIAQSPVHVVPKFVLFLIFMYIL